MFGSADHSLSVKADATSGSALSVQGRSYVGSQRLSVLEDSQFGASLSVVG